MSKLQGVADTLFIPLTARVFASKKYPEYFYDKKALQLERYIPENTIKKKSSEYSLMASVARYYNMDAMVEAFMNKHKACNVVYLGAGLETAYYRLNPQNAMFYEVDLPEVIDQRIAALGEQENDVAMGGDAFDIAWAATIDTTLPTLLVASGIFQYFTEERVVTFIHDVRDIFDFAELIFDATNEEGLRFANRYVQKTGNSSALMYFYVNDGAVFAKSTNTKLLEQRPFFADARRILKKKLSVYSRIAMKVADDKNRTIILHLKLRTVT